MKKLKTCLAFFICCILSLNMVICNVKADNNVVLSKYRKSNIDTQ